MLKRAFVLRKIALFYVLIIWISTAQAVVTLSPNQITGDTIPGNLGDVNYILSDGNWKPAISLPAKSVDQTKITITSYATFSSNINLTNTDLPIQTLNLSTGESVKFTYSATQQKWIYITTPKTPNANGSRVPISSTDKIVVYQMQNGNWTRTVNMPSTAKDGQVIVIRSAATQTATIDPQYILFASSFTLPSNQQYGFIFKENLNRWIPLRTPVARYDVSKIGATLPQLTVAPVNLVQVTGANSYTRITLPTQANDRDKLIIISSSTGSSSIYNPKDARTMKLAKGDRYDFLYIKDIGAWNLQYLPKRYYTTSTIPNGVFPNQSSPYMQFEAADSSWVSTVTLPDVASAGDKVMIKNYAKKTLSVKAKKAGFTSSPIISNDKIEFVYDSNGTWQKLTNTITLLMVYSDQAVAAIGEEAERARLFEGVRLTNQALINSNANFYFKPVSFLKRKAFGGTLDNALTLGINDPIIQNLRNQVKADAMYYEGTEAGCGLAFVSSTAHTMLASGSLGCGTTVMRHELGHNMGLSHCPGEGRPAYASGFGGAVPDVMCGNGISYYSSPKLYMQDNGIRMGIENQVDGVRAMNERSMLISNFR